MEIFTECKECEEYFLSYPNIKNKRVCCSRECAAKQKSKNFSGINSPRWKGKEYRCTDCGNLCDNESKRCRQCYFNHVNKNIIPRKRKNKEKIIRVCETCKKEYIVKRKIREQSSRYCSNVCFLNRGKDLTKKSYQPKTFCLDCNKQLKNRYAKYCRSCFGKHQSQENHPNWKDNATVKQRGMRWTYEYRIWRQSVLKRDKYHCQMPQCNKDYNLQVHHIETMKKSPDMIYNINNGITLCKDCHLSIASKEQDYEQIFKNIVLNRLCLV